MSRRKSSVLLPFNATATRTGNHSSHAENVTHMRSFKTPAKRRRTQVEIPDQEIDKDVLEVWEGKLVFLASVIRYSQLNHNHFSLSRHEREVMECFQSI